jgi:hypothetical protein
MAIALLHLLASHIYCAFQIKVGDIPSKGDFGIAYGQARAYLTEDMSRTAALILEVMIQERVKGRMLVQRLFALKVHPRTRREVRDPVYRSLTEAQHIS